ncbi:uncharacterized protein LOC125033441 [Penaeus chinensis]|uniref:uncharacterized protein LOC125033441 n=1 Tax=Penaeus chinensis TaxID=139456 RepID=UPI001FB7A19C|nr:uncharacterized protein LOC125033441 [Penaeus chinensis]
MRNGTLGSPERLKMTAIFLLLLLGHSTISHQEEPADPIAAEEEEVLEGPEELRFHGLNILGRDLDVQMSDPSERELKNLAKPAAREAPGLTLEQLKEKYREKLEELERRQQQKRYNRDEL